MTSPTMYYYTKVLSELFLDAPYADTRNNFRGSTQVMDFWRVRYTSFDAFGWAPFCLVCMSIRKQLQEMEVCRDAVLCSWLGLVWLSSYADSRDNSHKRYVWRMSSKQSGLPWLHGEKCSVCATIGRARVINMFNSVSSFPTVVADISLIIQY